ncbi:MAG: zinc ribbon domain-containing protein [Lachnospiraceae bacterium]|jgi:uncharacterized membrane protein YvbJ|nr:zinc ribbon domain-containing protein [Lachnospiraceae bacterium]NLC74621.1 zinc ribbon domain-containing protein [Clostridiales bacterium]
MKCNNCGAENKDGAVFCENCGAKLGNDQQQQTQQSQAGQSNAQQSAPVNNAPTMTNIPPEYEPISMWGYFGYELLFSIPCVGFIVLIVFACGANSNKNVTNFARSYFCFLIIVAVFLAIIIGCTVGFAGAAGLSGMLNN